MARIHTTCSLQIGDAPEVNFHCNHDDGDVSWRVEVDDSNTIYFHGTADQLSELADAMQEAAVSYRGREANKKSEVA